MLPRGSEMTYPATSGLPQFETNLHYSVDASCFLLTGVVFHTVRPIGEFLVYLEDLIAMILTVSVYVCLLQAKQHALKLRTESGAIYVNG